MEIGLGSLIAFFQEARSSLELSRNIQISLRIVVTLAAPATLMLSVMVCVPAVITSLYMASTCFMLKSKPNNKPFTTKLNSRC